jgi:RNA polymerase sigma-70 factor, ECF subfamily
MQTSGESASSPVLEFPRPSDETLMERVKEGQREALGELFRRHARPVRNVAHRILRDEAEADDVVQDVFIFIFRRAIIYNPQKASAISWIIQVAYSKALDRRRYLDCRGHYAPRDQEAHEYGVIEPFFVDQLAAKTLLQEMRKDLSEDQFQTMEMFFFDGYTFREIAMKMNVDIGAVRNRYYRGLERLRLALQRMQIIQEQRKRMMRS